MTYEHRSQNIESALFYAREVDTFLVYLKQMNPSPLHEGAQRELEIALANSKDVCSFLVKAQEAVKEL